MIPILIIFISSWKAKSDLLYSTKMESKKKSRYFFSIFFSERRVFILSEDLAKTDQSETSIMKLAYAKNNIIADKKRRIFFKNFYIVLPRSTHQEASIELSFVLFGSVGASEKNLHSEKKLVKIYLKIYFFFSIETCTRVSINGRKCSLNTER